MSWNILKKICENHTSGKFTDVVGPWRSVPLFDTSSPCYCSTRT